MNIFSARVLLLTLFSFAFSSLAFADQPTVGDVVYFDGASCSLLHLDPSTGVADVISRWNCYGATGSTVGTGPTNWSPSDGGQIGVSPDGWIYLKGFGTPCCGANLYRIDAGTGDREFLAVIPAANSEGGFGFILWPGPSFFTPSVAALSAGAVALLVGLIAGMSLRRGKQRDD